MLRALLAASLPLLLSLPCLAASHPPGVAYPLKPAAIQPAGLAQPLPSTRRYVLVWKDQLADAVQSITPEQKDWIVEHYVGTQKLFRRQIDEYRAKNPNFLMLTYHLAYGLNGADQTGPVGNVTGADRWGQEDTDNFTPYVQAHSLARENAYQHSGSPGTSANRVSYPDPYWLMDLSSPEWRSYLFDTLVAWQQFPTTGATGVFLDVAFPPWYGYEPASWWTGPAGGSSRQALRDWWNPRAKDYFDAMRAAFAKTAAHPRFLVIPNPDALVDGTDEPQFLEGTDGAFTENWQVAMANAGDWNLSVRRICKYVTGAGKVWMADVTKAGTDLTQAERELLLGTFLLARNGTSYLMLGNSDLTWYPEYEIDLGGYEAEPPTDLEDLRVAGAGGSAGGLYARRHAAGLVLVNSSAGALSTTLTSAMKRAHWSGGGEISATAQLAAQTLTWDEDVPAGAFSLPARSVAILRDPAGPPAPGIEPGDPVPSADAGTPGAPDAALAPADASAVLPTDAALAGTDAAIPAADAGSASADSGCACASTAGAAPSGLAALVLALACLRRRAR